MNFLTTALLLTFVVLSPTLANTQGATAPESCPVPTVSLPEFTAAFEAKDQGNNNEAIVNMEKLITKFKGSPGPYYILGNWYWELGEKDKADRMWKKARTASPT